MRSRIAVLASGGGSNLQALLDHLDTLADRRSGEVVVVASDRKGAGALDRARRHGIPVSVLATTQRPDGDSLAAVLEAHAVDLIVLAGFLRLVPLDIVRRYEGRIINIHPALLPAFGGAGMYGQRVHRAVIESGVRVTGVTAHFVDEIYDRGRIIAQWPVPVLPGDDADTLAARVLCVEHTVYPRVVDAVAAGRITFAGCASMDDHTAANALADTQPTFTLVPHGNAHLAQSIERALGA